MSVDQKRVIALALESLMAERDRVDAEIAELQTQLRTGKSPAQAAARRILKRRKAKVRAQGKTKKVKAAAGQRGRRNRKTAAAMRLLWEKAHKAGFTNLRDYKASLNAQ
ncbi:MAG: hypothetical protein ONB48_21655 [candidate division KSB1 bacterium]|nr:hypothetical protein [candidate division KSB1 bacterium]MDZ7276645.1 hypothetical protein [candidate division KSB1 bacterium]MDZ7288255.1 hypothetical protein [candidate division KSB1 bacterium]MDZ7300483.1 hypothetical protein [candidate division KSB1 bacterium]MDZ7306832.1 hypothetical protein [candidate division KSB1 bacterium]